MIRFAGIAADRMGYSPWRADHIRCLQWGTYRNAQGEYLCVIAADRRGGSWLLPAYDADLLDSLPASDTAAADLLRVLTQQQDPVEVGTAYDPLTGRIG